MAKLVKILLILVGIIVGLGAIAAVALLVFFDPNDFREEISAKVSETTGRDFAIEGELSVSLFPWLAVEVGRTTLGNAPGFGDEPFASFETARLSVEVLPLILRREVSIGAASLEGLVANLAVRADGTTNWDDLTAGEEAAEPEASADERGTVALDIESVRLGDATINYADAASGSRYAVTGLTMTTGAVALGQPFDVAAEFDFAAEPGELGGSLSIDGRIDVAEDMNRLALAGLSIDGSLRGIRPEGPTDFRFESRAIEVDLAGQRVSPGELELGVLGLAMSADVEPFSYAGTPEITAALRVAEFSLKRLLATLGSEPPVTADPNALERLSASAKAVVGQESIRLDALTLKLDDTTLTGTLSVPLTESGFLAFDLAADTITLDNYMAPAEEGAAAEEAPAADVEIPVELIRALKARGSMRLAEAFLGPVTFTNMELGVNGADGKLRLHPIKAGFFDGGYSGDVRVDASGSVPSLSVDETISDVNLASMAKALFDAGNITGTIGGRFALGGSGATLSAIRRDLDGNMAIALADGAWQGIDVWHQLRTARAIYKRETPPAPRTPARTEFSEVTATGVVTDGVFTNDDLVALMPFLRVTGSGQIDLATAEIDYSVQARVLEKPEFMRDASEDEISDFTKALIPIRVRGPLASPSFRPDIEAMFKAEVEKAIEEKKEDLKQRVLDQLLGGQEPPEAEGAAGEGADTEPEEEEEEKDLEDELKDRLKDLFPR